MKFYLKGKFYHPDGLCIERIHSSYYMIDKNENKVIDFLSEDEAILYHDAGIEFVDTRKTKVIDIAKYLKDAKWI